MCGKSLAVRRPGFDNLVRRHRRDYFGLDVEKLGARARVGVGLAVLGPVALSGVLLVAFVPGLWWIFTTYFWVAFPAVGLLGSGIAGLGRDRAERAERVAAMDPERDLLVALLSHGEMTAAGAAAETGLSIDEADRRLGELAEAGHLEVRVRGGGIFYALWEYDQTASEGV